MNTKVMNPYYGKFHSCMRAWLMGLITGIPIGAALAFLFNGFQLDTVFFVMLPFTAFAGIWVMATVFALGYTSGFGCSCIPLTIFRLGNGFIGIFSGIYLLLWVVILLWSIWGCIWLFGLFVFMGLFPLQTIYYGIRYGIAQCSVSKLQAEMV